MRESFRETKMSNLDQNSLQYSYLNIDAKNVKFKRATSQIGDSSANLLVGDGSDSSFIDSDDENFSDLDDIDIQNFTDKKRGANFKWA